MAQLTPEIVSAAIEGFENQKRRIDEQLSELRSMLDGNTAPTNAPARRKGRRISAEGRARIAEAQRKRWAASRGEVESVTPPPAPSKRKRKLSKTGRANIVAALKKRWAAKKAEGATAKAVTAKKAAPKPKKTSKRAAVKKAVKRAAPASIPATIAV